jgi:hypothetical protein
MHLPGNSRADVEVFLRRVEELVLHPPASSQPRESAAHAGG